MVRYVTLAEARAASGITSTDLISDADFTQIIERQEFSVEQYLNASFTPATVIEQYSGNSSERIILKRNPVLKIRALTIDETVIDPDDLRYDKESGIVSLTSGADTRLFKWKFTEDKLVRFKYDHGWLKDSPTQTTTSNAEEAGDSVLIEVAATTGFSVDDFVEIQGMDSKQETVKITSVDSGVSITVDNLAINHEASSLVTLQIVPPLVERYMLVASALAGVARVVGSTFDEITRYELGDLSVSKGEPFTQWRETATQLRKEWLDIRQSLRIRPAVG